MRGRREPWPFTFRGSEAVGIDLAGARNATVAEIRAIGNVAGMGTALSVGNKFLSNVVPDSSCGRDRPRTARDVTSQGTMSEHLQQWDRYRESANTTVASNDLTGNGLGIFVEKSTETKTISNDIRDTTFGARYPRFDRHQDPLQRHKPLR